MALWMIYAVLVAALVALGALAVERAVRVVRLPARWIWAAAIPLSIGLSMRSPAPRAAPDLGVSFAPDHRGVAGQQGPRAWRVILTERIGQAAEWLDVSNSAPRLGAAGIVRVDDRLAVAMWLTLSGGLAFLFFGVQARFVAARRRWPRAELHGAMVHISSRLGPAAIGLVKPRIVVPQWLLARPESDQRLALAHESEHLRARDPQLLAAACLAVVLFPWNPALWFVVARLRLAIEVDCDRRVLRRGTPAAAYGSLLVSVAELATPLRPSALALADDSSHLKTRILAMDPRRHRFARIQILAAAVLTGVALLAACEAKAPTAADIDRLSGASAESGARQLGLIRPDTDVAYVVDGARVAAQEGRAIPASDIARMSIAKDGGKPTVLITRKGAITLQRRRPPGDSSLANEVGSLAVDARGGAAKERVKWPSDTAIVWFLNGARADASVIQALDRTQIENVDVLKGPAAEQEFGVAAGKAVVSIRTKR